MKKKKKKKLSILDGHKFQFQIFYIYIEREREREFKLMLSVLDDCFLLLDQDTNRFWCKQGLNPGYFIQPTKILPVLNLI